MLSRSTAPIFRSLASVCTLASLAPAVEGRQLVGDVRPRYLMAVSFRAARLVGNTQLLRATARQFLLDL